MKTKISQTVAAIAEQDVYDALLTKYGASRIDGPVRSKDGVRYIVETHSKRYLNCHVRSGDGGVTIIISPVFGWTWAVVILGGLAVFVLPGLLAGLWACSRYLSTANRLPRYLEDISRLAEYQARERLRGGLNRGAVQEPAMGGFSQAPSIGAPEFTFT
jgi:hypothetical protein